jgi:hypothetical protein
MAVVLACKMSDATATSPTPERVIWKQDRIWITFWSAPPESDVMLRRVKDEHFNMTWTSESGLQIAARHGLRAMLHDEMLLKPEALDDPKRKQQLDSMIDRVKKHPALEAYFLVDEPTVPQFAGLARLVTYLRQKDPAHVAFINLLPSYTRIDKFGVNLFTLDAYGDYLRQFVTTVKPSILSYDHYHLYRSTDPPDFYLNLEKIRAAAVQNKIPFINIIQACQWTQRWRMPNYAELRWMVYSSLAYGARGIAYFLYWGPKQFGGLYRDGQPMPVVRDVAILNAEIEALSPELMRLQSTAVYHTDPLPNNTKRLPADLTLRVRSTAPLVVGLFDDEAKNKAFMVVNRSYRAPAVVQLSVSGNKGISAFNASGRSWQSLNTNSKKVYEVTLEAGQGRLFKMLERN